MILRIFTKLSLSALLLCGMSPVYAQTDITANGGVVTAQYSNGNVAENYQNLTDNNVNTKYYIDQTAYWLGYQSTYTAIVTQYTITSANDASGRDPKSWTLTASNDGNTWTTIDTQTNQTFANRFQTNTYTFSNSTGYLYYRLNVTANNGAGDSQLAEWHLAGSASGPAAPTGLTVTLSTYNASLNWSDNSTNETGFQVQTSIDGINFSTIYTTSANQHTYGDSGISASTAYEYRVIAVNAGGISAPAIAFASTPAAPSLTDITDFTNGVITDQYSTTGVEGIAKVTDNSVYTKYLTTHNATWLNFKLPAGGIAKQYAITSANDATDRDPKNWTFQGSNDSINWITLHTVKGQVFPSRYKRRLYLISNTYSYIHYRLKITANNGGAYTQLAELQIYGTGTGTVDTSIPAVPSGLTTLAVSGNQIILDWADNASNETRYTLERSTDSTNWGTSFTLDPNTTHFYSLELSPLTTYYYRLKAVNANGSSAWVYAKNTTLTNVPPATWKEHWFEHNQLLSLVYSNSSVNIYYDSATPTSITWMNQDFTDVWNYVKQNYGTFSDPKVNMVFHSNGYSGGHPATVFDSNHDYRNVGDLGGEWSTRSSWNVGASIHEIGHIVEGGSKGVKKSPAFAIWNDSKWNEIFIYDVTKRLGWTADAQQTYNDVINGQDNYPRPGTRWFKNWFYPIYTHADSSAALNRFFVLLSQYFPQHNGEYTRDLNMGEFIHFWSGAAQYNLKAQADTAFGWNSTYEQQFKQAQIDFPFTYPDVLVSPIAVVKPTHLPSCLRIWPNPAANTVYLTLPEDKQYTIDVYSVSGIKTLSQRVKGTSSTLNVSDLPDGLYIVTVTDGKKVISKEKVVVSNKHH
ncbi:Por secretion system C-terminal sorting domain-containing protein [Chitinophaga sp. YR573]|uniref:T9SS type A sorting domain-containing protein n=1 Tax=Chitinophaga sp. YR573 TaxID=1881040 RepID=UPI0008B681AD|nr:fibronectin type III domain-containing protein [Chitinophaga sp. YR573]SEW07393.1 Por secretion system C-terminal sorting domain-containing protein [Chitinophaga sp. YR573]